MDRPWSLQSLLHDARYALKTVRRDVPFFLFATLIIGIGEDIPKTLVRKVTGNDKRVRRKKKLKKEAVKKRAEPPPPTRRTKSQPKKTEDFFGGFGDFGN